MVEYPPNLSDVYAALGSDVRRAIVDRLARGEARVTDVAAPFGISLAAVSKHVLVLERAGLIKRRVEGRTHWLALAPAALVDAETWIERTRSFWSGRLDALDALLRTDDTRPAPRWHARRRRRPSGSGE
jgi:DNA-binding transcriptional ArsR family regulator